MWADEIKERRTKRRLSPPSYKYRNKTSKFRTAAFTWPSASSNTALHSLISTLQPYIEFAPLTQS